MKVVEAFHHFVVPNQIDDYTTFSTMQQETYK